MEEDDDEDREGPEDGASVIDLLSILPLTTATTPTAFSGMGAHPHMPYRSGVSWGTG